MVDDLTVRDVMTRDYVGVSESDTVTEAAELMLGEGESVIAVVRGSEPIGMVMERQLIEALLHEKDPSKTRIDAVMHRPPRSIQPDVSLAEAAAILADADTDHVFVSAGDGVLGVLSENDLITAVTSILTTEPGESYDQAFDVGMTTEPQGSDTMSAQSVCEVCGTLKASLENVNGQLVCGDCRSV